MAHVRIDARVSDFQSEIHTVISRMDTAAFGVLEDLREIGLAAARGAMPTGSYESSHDHHDGERPPLQETLHSEHFGRTLNIWIEDVNAMSLDQGSEPHEIHGNPLLKFFWERKGVEFRGPMVNHPGTGAYHFMDAGFDAIDAAAERILDAHYL